MFRNTITASKLYDFIQCPHRVWRDVYGPSDEKIVETNPFVQLLWDKGIQHEKKIIATVGEYLDLGEGSIEEREMKTTEAIKSKVKIIYQGVIRYENLLGSPDLLMCEGDEYMPVDIKSGMGTEGDDSSGGVKLKKHYAVQLCLYLEVLQKLGLKKDSIGKIIDGSGALVIYDMNEAIGKKDKTTYWDFYMSVKERVSDLLQNKIQNTPALAGICKLCDWYTSCKSWCIEKNDPTLIYYLGRAVRDTLKVDLNIQSVSQLLEINIEDSLEKKRLNKNFLKGIGESTLQKAVRRGEILSKKLAPVLYSKINLPTVEYELFFDIEDDPTQEFVYMHGVYERKGKNEKFIHFTAKSISAIEERKVWREFWAYIKTLPENNFAVYYYSHHEKTTYLKLQEKYPDVISKEEVEAFFEKSNVIDLFRIVNEFTDWPVGSYSLKELAMYLGFRWRDETPSGALSIQWFNEYINSKDENLIERILLYNEDDCKATMVLKDALQKMNHELRAT